MEFVAGILSRFSQSSLQNKVFRIVLNMCLQRYIKDLNLDEIDIRVQDGAFEIKNLQVKEDEVNKMLQATPLRVKRGEISSISLHIPFTDLGNQNSVFSIEGLRLYLTMDEDYFNGDRTMTVETPIKLGVSYSAEEFMSSFINEDSEVVKKSDFFDNIDESQENGGENDEEDEMKQVARMIERIISNFQFRLLNIQVEVNLLSSARHSVSHDVVFTASIPSLIYYDGTPKQDLSSSKWIASYHKYCVKFSPDESVMVRLVKRNSEEEDVVLFMGQQSFGECFIITRTKEDDSQSLEIDLDIQKFHVHLFEKDFPFIADSIKTMVALFQRKDNTDGKEREDGDDPSGEVGEARPSLPSQETGLPGPPKVNTASFVMMDLSDNEYDELDEDVQAGSDVFLSPNDSDDGSNNIAFESMLSAGESGVAQSNVFFSMIGEDNKEKIKTGDLLNLPSPVPPHQQPKENSAIPIEFKIHCVIQNIQFGILNKEKQSEEDDELKFDFTISNIMIDFVNTSKMMMMNAKVKSIGMFYNKNQIFLCHKRKKRDDHGIIMLSDEEDCLSLRIDSKRGEDCDDVSLFFGLGKLEVFCDINHLERIYDSFFLPFMILSNQKEEKEDDEMMMKKNVMIQQQDNNNEDNFSIEIEKEEKKEEKKSNTKISTQVFLDQFFFKISMGVDLPDFEINLLINNIQLQSESSFSEDVQQEFCGSVEGIQCFLIGASEDFKRNELVLDVPIPTKVRIVLSQLALTNRDGPGEEETTEEVEGEEDEEEEEEEKKDGRLMELKRSQIAVDLIIPHIALKVNYRQIEFFQKNVRGAIKESLNKYFLQPDLQEEDVEEEEVVLEYIDKSEIAPNRKLTTKERDIVDEFLHPTASQPRNNPMFGLHLMIKRIEVDFDFSYPFHYVLDGSCHDLEVILSLYNTDNTESELTDSRYRKEMTAHVDVFLDEFRLRKNRCDVFLGNKNLIKSFRGHKRCVQTKVIFQSLNFVDHECSSRRMINATQIFVDVQLAGIHVRPDITNLIDLEFILSLLPPENITTDDCKNSIHVTVHDFSVDLSHLRILLNDDNELIIPKRRFLMFMDEMKMSIDMIQERDKNTIHITKLKNIDLLIHPNYPKVLSEVMMKSRKMMMFGFLNHLVQNGFVRIGTIANDCNILVRLLQQRVMKKYEYRMTKECPNVEIKVCKADLDLNLGSDGMIQCLLDIIQEGYIETFQWYNTTVIKGERKKEPCLEEEEEKRQEDDDEDNNITELSLLDFEFDEKTLFLEQEKKKEEDVDQELPIELCDSFSENCQVMDYRDVTTIVHPASRTCEMNDNFFHHEMKKNSRKVRKEDKFIVNNVNNNESTIDNEKYGIPEMIFRLTQSNINISLFGRSIDDTKKEIKSSVEFHLKNFFCHFFQFRSDEENKEKKKNQIREEECEGEDDEDDDINNNNNNGKMTNSSSKVRMKLFCGIQDLDIIDKVHDSNRNLIFSFLRRSSHPKRIKGSNIFEIHVNQSNNIFSSFDISVKILPFRLNLHQNTVIFFLSFLSKIMKHENEKKKKEDGSVTPVEILVHPGFETFEVQEEFWNEIRDEDDTEFKLSDDDQNEANLYISSLRISEFIIRIDYEGTKSLFVDEKMKHALVCAGLLEEDPSWSIRVGMVCSNLLSVKNLMIEKPEFCIQRTRQHPAFSFTSEIIPKLMEHYKDSQLFELLFRVSVSLLPVKRITSVGKGFSDIFVIPFREFQDGTSTLRGVRQGLGSFVRTVGSEIAGFGSDVMNVTSHDQKKRRNVRGFDEGKDCAISELTQMGVDLGHLVFGIKEVYNEKGLTRAGIESVKSVPYCILRPISGLTNATAKVLDGVHNSLGKDKNVNEKEFEDMFKRRF